MAELRLSQAARGDLDTIQDNGLEAFGVEAVRRHMSGFERIFALLRKHPFAGEARPIYGKGLRAIALRPHRILYRVDDDTVLIVRVVHAAMDVRGLSDSDQ